MELGVFNYQNRVSSPKLNFKRKLREDEKPKMEADMNKAFEYLGIKNRALIMHGSVYPDSKAGVKNPHTGIPLMRNHYVGTPYRQSDVNKIVKMHGFNWIQLGPNGELCKGDNSPYRASIYAKNPLFLDYGELTTDKYANILTKDDIDEVNTRPKKSRRDYEMSDFDEAREISKILTGKAYKNFESKLEKGDVNAQKLDKEFTQFKKDNEWVEKYAVVNVLSNLHGTDNFHKWDNPVDKHIFKLKKEGHFAAEQRYNTIIERSKDDINQYMFTQFMVDKQEKADKLEREKDGIKVIGDLLVGFSYADELVHEDAFTSGWKIGAEFGGPCNSPQIWNNPLPDPNKLFNEDGSLGESGKLLYNKVLKATENVENVRVDNVMGLVDPYVYKADTVQMIVDVEGGRTHNIADRRHLNGGNLSTKGEVDPEGNYKNILHNIVIPALEENGINPKEAVWENLGEQSDTFKWVFEHEEKLPGIILSTGDRTQNLCFDWAPVRDVETGDIKKNSEGKEIWEATVPKPDWSMIGSHDNMPTFKYLEQGWINDPYNNGSKGWMPEYLGGYLCPDPEKSNERERLTDNIRRNPRMRLKAKYAELMRGTQNIQVTFADMFAIDKTYNPRDNSSDTWKTRLSEDFNDKYHKNLETEKKPVMNMPELVGLAVSAKAGMTIAKGIKPREMVAAESEPILRSMKNWENILKEPEA